MSAPASAAAMVYVLGDGERVHAESAFDVRAPVQAELSALRGETAAFQIVIANAGPLPIDPVTVDLGDLRSGSVHLPVLRYVEHFVDVASRSGSPGSSEALAWTAAARPLEHDVLGLVPDALIPLEIASCAPDSSRVFCPYPLAVVERSAGAMWFDVFVPLDTPAGLYQASATVRSGDQVIAAVPVELRVEEATLPDLPVSFFAYYERDTLQARFDDPDRVEGLLLQLLHAHHVDGVSTLTSAADVHRLDDYFDGSLFQAASGYRGPGAGRPPAIMPVGMYGALGDPASDSVRAALTVRGALPTGIDTFLYAIDEDCASPRGAAWMNALRVASPERLAVGVTCDWPPESVSTDVVLEPAQTFVPAEAERGRQAGKRVFVYNGAFPSSGPMVLDAPLTSLTIDGWLAATYKVDRWFLWETIFWNDGNRGGHGPHDVFDDPETFHNWMDDRALLDGLLVYPGRQPFAAHSLETDDVLPSLRLQALRRGIEDAGLLALAAQMDADAALAIDRRIIGAGFGEADPNGAPRFELDPRALAEARADLRAIIARGRAGGERDRPEVDTDDEARRALAGLQRARAESPAPRFRQRLLLALSSAALVVLVVLLVALLGRAARGRRSRA